MVRFTKINNRCSRTQSKKELSIDDAYSIYRVHNESKNLSTESLRYYDENYRYFIASIPGDLLVKEVCIEDIEQFILFLKKNTSRTDTSINSAVRAIRAFLYFCMERGYVEPFKIKIPKADEKIKETYSDGELQKLLRKPRSESWSEWRTWALVNYLVGTGHRASTVTNLKVKDIDFTGNRIKLTHTKNRQHTYTPLASALKEVLQEYLLLWDYTADDYLFPNRKGLKMSISSLQNIIRRYNSKRGVARTGIHLFRHTFAKNYIIAGGDLVRLQKLLGHSTLDMTKKYVNLYGNDLVQGFEQFNPLNRILNK